MGGVFYIKDMRTMYFRSHIMTLYHWIIESLVKIVTPLPPTASVLAVL